MHHYYLSRSLKHCECFIDTTCSSSTGAVFRLPSGGHNSSIGYESDEHASATGCYNRRYEEFPLKIPSRGEEVVVPSYTLTISYPPSVLNAVNVRVMCKPSEGCISFVHNMLLR